MDGLPPEIPGILVPEITHGLPGVLSKMGEDVPIVPLPDNEDVLLDQLVTFLRIVVSLTKAVVSRLVVFPVLDHPVPEGREHPQKLVSVENTAVPVDLRKAVQLEIKERTVIPGGRLTTRRDSSLREFRNRKIHDRGDVQSHCKCPKKGRPKTVRNLHQLRRDDLQCLYETVVTVDLYVKERQDVIERDLRLGETVVLVGDLPKGIGEVESEILFLGIQHQRKLVAVFHQLDQVLVLTGLLRLETDLASFQLGICFGKLVTQDLEGLRYVFLVEHG